MEFIQGRVWAVLSFEFLTPEDGKHR